MCGILGYRGVEINVRANLCEAESMLPGTKLFIYILSRTGSYFVKQAVKVFAVQTSGNFSLG